jgi:protein TonB
MDIEPVNARTSSGPPSSQAWFDRCLVDGDAAEASRRRRSRRRALGISFVVETVLLGLVILVPLMSSVAQPHLTRAVYIPFASGAPGKPKLDLKPAPPNQQLPNVADRFTIFPGGRTPRQTAAVVEGADETGLHGESVLLIPLDLETSVILNVEPPSPVAPPPEGTKKTPDKRPLKLSEGVVQAQLVSRVEPRYPVLAVQIRLQGTVRLHAIISRDGRITALEVVSGHPLLVQSALDAVRQWRYRPTLLDGEPVEVETTISVVFQLHN